MRILLLLSLVAFCLGSTLDSWYLQTSTDVKDSGKMISTVGYQDKSWYPVTVPCTVIACLLQNNVYQDPFFGENLKRIFYVVISLKVRNPFRHLRSPMVVSNRIQPSF